MPEIRRAEASDLEAVTETLWLAFEGDPLWSWAFPDHAQLRPLWRMFVGSALAHQWVWIAGECVAAAVWIPPGVPELAPQEEQQLEGLVRELAGARAPSVLALFDRFEQAHPTEPQHYYLSLLGTHPQSRGRGVGMELLADNLRRVDADRAPAYLESSNPTNESRYERVGFARHGGFETPDGAHSVATMWRAPVG